MTEHSDFFQRYAFISLGANLDSSIGSPQESIRYAITVIAEFSQEPLLIASLLETEPLDCPPGSPKFVNGLIGLIPAAEESSLSLLRRLQQVENTVGRTRSGVVNEARVMDLDLITFKDEVSTSDELILPHPRACERKFVLEPLREIIGDAVFPGQNLSLDSLITGL